MAVANQSHEYFASQLRIFARIYTGPLPYPTLFCQYVKEHGGSVLIVLLGLVVVKRMVQPEICQYTLWCSSVQAYCFSSTFDLFLCSVVADDSESGDSTGGGVSCGTGEADGSPDVLDFPFPFPLPFGGISTNCLTKNCKEMSQLTAFENDEHLSRDLFAKELRLNSDRIATLRTN